MASEPVRANQDTVFKVGQVWKDEAYDGVFSITAVPGVHGAAFDTAGWGNTRLDHSWDTSNGVSIIRRWSLVKDVSDETHEPEPEAEPGKRWGVIDLDWLDKELAWLKDLEGQGDLSEFGEGGRDAWVLVREKVVEL